MKIGRFRGVVGLLAHNVKVLLSGVKFGIRPIGSELYKC